VLVPELRRATESGSGLRTLYLIEDLDEIEPGALWAIVTDVAWMARASKVFLWMIPGEARVYPVAELEEAKAWVAG
jgi:hypothetical protein